jgi:LysM repeat protein
MYRFVQVTHLLIGNSVDINSKPNYPQKFQHSQRASLHRKSSRKTSGTQSPKNKTKKSTCTDSSNSEEGKSHRKVKE